MKIFQPNTDIRADEVNINFGLDSQSITYDDEGRVSTITDIVSSEVLTFTYNDDDNVETITDGVNTWTFTYNDDQNVTAITRTP